MYLTDTEYTFVFNDVLKHFRPSFKEKPLVFRAFPQNPKLCPISTLIQYLGMRLSRSSNTVLFFTIDSPYKAASSETMGRWIKNTMQEAGINTFFFQPVVVERLLPVKPMLLMPELQQYYSRIK